MNEITEKLIISGLTKKFSKNEGIENINISVKRRSFSHYLDLLAAAKQL